jgi:hypothetical protein
VSIIKIKNYSVQNMFEDKYPLDLEECKRSNLLLTGCNQQGKSLLAMTISDILKNEGWQIIVFDSVGHWKEKSSIPIFYEVSEATLKYALPSTSIIFDVSRLLPFMQREFIEMVLHDLWKLKLDNPQSAWLLIVLEEAHLYMRNIRGLVSQNLLRICSVGANHGIRTLAISPSLTGLDTEFIRLAQQRYHFKLGVELNARRRFRGYYSKDWCYVAEHLDVGETIYYNNGKLRVYDLPLFVSDTTSQHYIEPQRHEKKRSWIDKLLGIDTDDDIHDSLDSDLLLWEEFSEDEEV